MSSWVQCVCGNLVHKNLFCGANVSISVPEAFFDADRAGMSAEEFINELLLNNDTVVRCGKCQRGFIINETTGSVADVYKPDIGT